MLETRVLAGQFCRHAKGSLEDVVKEAIRQGFSVYGLSEHIPRHRREELYPEEQDLQPEDLETTFDAYIQEAKRLKALYADQIELLVGLETEYITPDTLYKLDVLLERYSDSLSYLVGSLHHVDGIPIDFDRETFDRAVAGFPEQKDGITQLEHFFCAYFDAQYELMQRFHPEVIGHIDLCRLYLPEARFYEPKVWKRIERNVSYGIEYGALFEVNAAAFRKGWKAAYPSQDVLKLIRSLGGRLTLSDDSHGPHAVGLHYKDALNYLVEQDVQELWVLTTKEASGGADNDKDDTPVKKSALRRKTVARKLESGWRDAFLKQFAQ